MTAFSDRIRDALDFAARCHAGQVRKGSDTPYLTHPVGVAWILLEAGAAEEVVMAGLLHDVLEDADVAVETVRERFGDRVAAAVVGCSEPDKSLPWIERKEHTIRQLQSADDDVLAVAAADKLHNVLCMTADCGKVGGALWGRFKQGLHHQAWYYGSVCHAILGAARIDLARGIAMRLLGALDQLFAPDFESRWRIHPDRVRRVSLDRREAAEKAATPPAEGETWLLAIDPERATGNWVRRAASGGISGGAGHEDVFPLSMVFVHPDGFLPGGDWTTALPSGNRAHDGVYRSWFIEWT